jgi:hypothetical protein
LNFFFLRAFKDIKTARKSRPDTMWHGGFNIYIGADYRTSGVAAVVDNYTKKGILSQDKLSDMENLFNNSFYIDPRARAIEEKLELRLREGLQRKKTASFLQSDELLLRVSSSEDPNNIYKLFEKVNQISEFLLENGYNLRGSITWKGSTRFLQIVARGWDTQLLRTRPWDCGDCAKAQEILGYPR